MGNCCKSSTKGIINPQRITPNNGSAVSEEEKIDVERKILLEFKIIMLFILSFFTILQCRCTKRLLSRVNREIKINCQKIARTNQRRSIPL